MPFPFQTVVLIPPTTSKSLYSSHNPLLVLILHIPYSTTGPYTILNILHRHVFSRTYLVTYMMSH